MYLLEDNIKNALKFITHNMLNKKQIFIVDFKKTFLSINYLIPYDISRSYPCSIFLNNLQKNEASEKCEILDFSSTEYVN